MQFKPGQLSVEEASALNKLMRDVEILKQIKVPTTGRLELNKTPSGWVISNPVGNGVLSIPVAYCDANGELAYYYICVRGDFTWSIGSCDTSSSSGS